MNAFEQTLTTALRDHAGEIAMSTNLNDGRVALDEKLDKVDRQRRRWQWGAAAAAVAVVALVLAFVAVARPNATPQPPPVGGPTSPAPEASPFHVSTSTLTPNLTVDLPAWAASAKESSEDTGVVFYSQKQCPESTCPAQLAVGALSVESFYRPQAGLTVSRSPSFAAYVAHLDSLAASGYATLSDRRTTTVDGRPAVTLTLQTSREIPALSCGLLDQPAAECWNVAPGLVVHLVVVDQGKAAAPTMFYEWQRSGTPTEAPRAEFDRWVASVRFG